ncbi:MAG TPA: winged helix-turn-helix domain-containing protein [Bryobacteraceae bacterium]|nr:winged helix-turn-helix domain-containing protein [Bryobacteraceae bacterium]
MSSPELVSGGALHRRYCFGEFTLDLDSGFLCRGPQEIALRPKPFEVLAYLVEHHGRLVTKDALIGAVWPDTAVMDNSLAQCIVEIRKALNDDSQQLIRTVPRRGYVFTAPVTAPAVEFPRQLPEAVQAQNSVRRPHIWAWVAALLAGATIMVVLLRVTGLGGKKPIAPEYTALTNFTDSAFSPALSLDGRMLAFIRGEDIEPLGGTGEIYVKLLPDGEPVQLTHDGKKKMSPVFTSQGDRIVYGVPGPMTDPTSWSTWTISVFGGEPKLLLSNASALTWVPGTSRPRVLFSQVDRGAHMSVVTSEENRTQARTVYSPSDANGMAHRSFLSPDRRQVLVVEMKGGGWQPCRLVPFEGGTGKLVGPAPGQCSSAAWSPDGKWMYFSVNTGNGYHIWRQYFPNGAPEQVTSGATEEQEIAFAADGKSFLTSVGIRQSTLWLHDARGERQITSQGYAWLPKFSPDGKKIYFLLRAQTNRQYVSGELWSADLETGQRARLLRDFLLADYSLSRDGDRIAFVAIGDKGESRLWLATLDGRIAPRCLSSLEADRAFFGVKGEVFFWGRGEQGSFVYRVREDGSELQRALPSSMIYVYDISPDAQALAAWRGSAVQVFPTSGGAPTDVSTVCAAAGGEDRGITPPCVSWSPGGEFLYLNDRTAGEIYAVPIPPGRSLPVLPAEGIASAEQAAALPGARVIHEPHAFVGADPSTYAFLRITNERNIYRVRVR